jgi:5-methylcytosine-specific restriction protein A
VTLREGIERVLAEYLGAKKQTFTQHPIACLIRQDIRKAVARLSGDEERLTFKGSAGQANWVMGPWIGVFNPLVTHTAQRGYYVCFLFREDMQGVYLSLNQAMTQAKDLYKSDAKTALLARAQNYRAMLGLQNVGISSIKIDLAPASADNDTAFYEAGNIYAKFYEAGSVPGDDMLAKDLQEMLGFYERLVVSEAAGEAVLDVDDDKPIGLEFEDATRFRIHKRIERRASLVKKVKKAKGCICEVCETNFAERYGTLGEGYIEAHHLKPLSSIKGTKVAMDPVTDFAVLCANCHRMVHRSGLVDDIPRFKREHFQG